MNIRTYNRVPAKSCDNNEIIECVSFIAICVIGVFLYIILAL